MTMLKRFSLYQWASSRIGFKLMAAIVIVAIIFIPITSLLSYQYTYIEEQQAAQERVSRMVDMVRDNAAMAAYLSDNSLASDVVSSLSRNPEIKAVRFSIASDALFISGSVPKSEGNIVENLSPSFSDTKVGKLELFLDYSYINNYAQDKAVSLVVWQSFLLLLILVCVYIIFRQVVSKPLNHLLEQINSTPVDGLQSDKPIHVSSSDEIGFLAENTNNLMNRISSFYRSEAKKNQQIVELEKQFRIIFEYSHAGIALIGEDNRIYIANQSFKDTIQCGDCEQSPIYLANLFDNSNEFDSLLQTVREEGQSLFKDFRLKNKPDTWLRVLFSHVSYEQNRDSEKFVELVVYDISDRAHKEKAFVYNANHDALTGIFNRRGAEARFKEQCSLAQQQDSHFVMFWLDLNDFKIVNDEHGHEAGDIVLKELSSRLRSVSRPDDIVARWGGDEFVIAIRLNDLAVLPNILKDMQNAFVTPIEISDNLSVTVGASIGVSTSLHMGYDVDKLLIRADQMMYQVKREGKSGFKVDGIPFENLPS